MASIAHRGWHENAARVETHRAAFVLQS